MDSPRLVRGFFCPVAGQEPDAAVGVAAAEITRDFNHAFMCLISSRLVRSNHRIKRRSAFAFAE